MKPDCIICDRPYHYGFAQLKDVLEMSVGTLVRLAAERASLHHDDETRLNFKVDIPNINVVSGSNVGGGGDEKVTKSLFGHVGCWYLNGWFFYRESDMRRDDARSDLPHELLWIFNEVCRQGETSHTLSCFHLFRRK
jgi:hypothetical protein